MARAGLPHARAQARRARRQPLRIAEDEWRPVDRRRAARARRRARVRRLRAPRCAQGRRRHRVHDARPRARSARPIARCSAGRRDHARDAGLLWSREASRRRARSSRSIRAPATSARSSAAARNDARGVQPRALRAAANPARRSSRSSTRPRLRAGHVAGLDRRRRAGGGRAGTHRSGAPRTTATSYTGRVTLATALTVSANAATVRVSRTVGEPNVIAAARRNGIVEPAARRAGDRARRRRRHAARARRRRTRHSPTAAAACARGSCTRIEAPDGTLLWSSEIAPRHRDGPARRVSDHVDAALVVDYGTGAHAARHRRRRGRSPARRARRTTATTSGSSATRRHSSPASGSATTRPRRSPRRVGRPLRRAGVGGLLPEWLARAARAPIRRARRHGDARDRSRVRNARHRVVPRRQREYFKPGTRAAAACNMHTEPFESQTVDNGEASPDAGERHRAIGKGIGSSRRSSASECHRCGAMRRRIYVRC